MEAAPVNAPPGPTYRQWQFIVVMPDGKTVERRMRAPTRSEGRGWLKRQLRADGVDYVRIISIR